jgi:hypothetical protein
MSDLPSHRICTKCGHQKPLTEFGPHAHGKYGRQSKCRACYATYMAAHRAKWAATHPAENQRAKREWRERNREAESAERRARWKEDPTRNKAWRERNKEKVADYGYAHLLKKKYGMTLEGYRSMVAAQGGCCAICREAVDGRRRFHLDHDHATNNVRALLCRACNHMLGNAKDNPRRLMAAIDYLVAHGAPGIIEAA